MSTTEATFSVVKGIAGAGMMALPYAFLQSGLLAGVVGVFILAALSSSSIKLLASIKRSLYGDAPVTYLDVGVRVLGEDAGKLISAAVCACSLGVSTAYLVFIQCTGRSLFPQLSALPSAVFVLAALPVILTLVLLRSYRLLAFTALIGDVSILLGTLCVVLSGLSGMSASGAGGSPPVWWPHPTSDLLVKPATFPLFLSTAAFLFCVHFFIIPVQNAMAEPSQFPVAVNRSFVITAAVNAAFGVVGLLCYANPSAIILNDVQGSGWVAAVKALLCLDMIFSYAVVFVPGREIVENALLGRESPPSSPVDRRMSVANGDGDDFHSAGVSVLPLQRSRSSGLVDSPEPISWWQLTSPASSMSLDGRRNVIRAALVLVTVVLAISLPWFGVVISLVGGLSMTALGFVFPPLMALRLRQVERQSAGGAALGEEERLLPSQGWRGDGVRKPREEWMEWLYYLFLIAFGVLIMALTIVTSTLDILRILRSDAPINSC